MKIEFSKYEGAGNDFIIIDNRSEFFTAESDELISWFCDRRFGVGADGLILLEDDETCSFRMRYFNSDGRESSMCGNGGRCVVAYAHRLKIADDKIKFMAIDGVHKAVVESPGIVNLKMSDVNRIEKGDGFYFADTGSPHHVEFVENLDEIDVVGRGRTIRNSARYQPEGVNVNFVKQNGNHLSVYTYERGVEDETLACGTGVTAAALCAGLRNGKREEIFTISTKGGELEVSFEREGDGFKNIWLKGPATFVFDGTVEL